MPKKETRDVLIRESVDDKKHQEFVIPGFAFGELLYDFLEVGELKDYNPEFINHRKQYRFKPLMRAMKKQEPLYLFTYYAPGTDITWRVYIQTRS